MQVRLVRFLVFVAALFALTFAFSPSLSANSTAPQRGLAPLIVPARAEKIAGQFIVVFKDTAKKQDMRQTTDRVVNKLKGAVLFEYRAALNGFAARLDKKALKRIRKDPRVAYVEQDTVVTLDDESYKPAVRPALDTDQSGATWGLDRIDQRNLPLNGIYSYAVNGTGVRAYVIDTGIRTTHSQFGGRASGAYTAISDGNGTNDCNGHGTHVAGTIGGSTYGVAKNVTLYAVRVLDCSGSGSNSGVIAGVNWVTANRVLPAVANMSLGGGASSALDTAVNNSINAGVVYGLAAGNSNVDACTTSPARVAAAITVGATTNTDARASYSNYGTCLDIFAPGSSITSAWNTSDTATNTISGTSMATPHVVGVAALYLQSNPGAAPAAVRNALVSNGTTNKVTGAGTGSPNVLLYSIFGAPSPTATPTSVAPSPTPTRTATGVAPTPTRTSTPPSGNNVVVNPGFESGPNVAWADTSSGGYEVIDTTRPRTGAYSAYFCGYNKCTDTLDQQVTVPANGTLTYYWYQASSEGTSTAYDYLYVRLYSTNNTLLTTLRTWSNRNARGAWALDTVSLAAYAGQTVRLRFVGTTDSSLTTSFFVDDVSVK